MGIFVFLLFIIPYINYWEDQKISQLKSNFELQFKDYLQMLAAELRTGHAWKNAMKGARRELELQCPQGSLLIQELTTMECLLDMNFTEEEVWMAFVERVNIESVTQFVTVFVVANQSGGDGVSIINRTIGIICETVEIEMEIGLLITGKKMEFQVMSLVPLGIILYMRFSFPEFMEVLYGNILGIVIMSGCLCAYGLAFWWGNKIIKIEV